MTQIFLSFIFRLHRLLFGVSALTFRCKPPLGASSPFTFGGISVYFSLQASLRSFFAFYLAESAFIFRCKLCIPLGTTFELLLFFFHCTRWCVVSLYIYIFGDITLIELKYGKEKLHVVAPLKTFLPLWKGKGCHKEKLKQQ
jgi:hypothetical protein